MEKARHLAQSARSFAATLTIVCSGVVIACPVPDPIKALCIAAAIFGAAIGGPETGVSIVFLSLPLWMLEFHLRNSIFSPLELALVLAAVSSGSWVTWQLIKERRPRSLLEWLPPADITLLAIALIAIAALSLTWVADRDLRPDSIRSLRRVIIEPIFVLPALTWLARRG